MTRQAFVDHRRRVCFFWSPRCASRSLAVWLFKTNVAVDASGLPPARAAGRLFGEDFATAAMLSVRQRYLAVALVRHPAQRVVSSYVSTFVRRGDIPLTRFKQLGRLAKRTVRQAASLDGGVFDEGAYQGLSLMELLDYVESYLPKFPEASSVHAHWANQIPKQLAEIGLRFDHVCAVETLQEDFRPIRRLYRTALPLPLQNQTAYGSPSASEDLSRTPSKLLAERNLDRQSLLGPEALRRIAEICKRDYALLGYDPEDPEAPPAIRANNRRRIDHPSQRDLGTNWQRRRELSWKLRQHVPRSPSSLSRRHLPPAAKKVQSWLAGVRPPTAAERQRALRADPTPLVADHLRLGVLFSPKAGCTFVTKWFFSQTGEIERALTHSPWIHAYRLEIYCQSDACRPATLLEPGMRVVKFVRNPYDRVVSSYLHAIRYGYADDGIQDFLARPIDRRRRFTFREFVAFLETQPLAAADCNPHHRCQVHECERIGLVRPTHVVQLEEIDVLLPRLEQELGLRTIDHRSLRGSTHHTAREMQAEPCADRADWAAPDGKLRKQFPATNCFYDDSLTRRVRALYGLDFERYGYDPTAVPSAVER